MTGTNSPRLHAFERQLAAAWPPQAWQDVTVVVAVSGGADSVALLRGLATLKSIGPGQLRAAHFNHCLRGTESDADAAFVKSLCEQLGMTCDVDTAQAAVESGGDGLEAAAREQRYAFLQSTAERCGARYVVTAHTADDQAETILHRIVRGTGLAGLTGMRRARPLGPLTLLRPLLEISRSEVEAYLAYLGQTFRQDSTNADSSFTRNRIRNELLPLLAAEYNPAVGDALRRLGQLAAEAQEVLRPQIDALLAGAVTIGNERAEESCVRIDCRQLAGMPMHLVRELLVALWQQQGWPLQAMSFEVWQSLAELAQAVDSNASSRTLPGRVRAQKKGGELLLARL